MSKTRKFLKWTAIVLAGLLIGLLLLLAAINAFDEDLRPEAVSFLDFSDDDVPLERNGFFAWTGLLVPVGQDPHQRGVEIITQVNELLDVATSRDIVDKPDKNALLGANRLQLTDEPAGICDRDTAGCLSRYYAKATDIERWVRENKILLDRYRALYAYPNFREILKPQVLTPIFLDPARVARIVRANIALQAMRGDTTSALRQLHTDTVYWRHLLVESRMLINKMIAVSVIRTNAQLVSEIVASRSIEKNALMLATETVRPLTDAEHNLNKVFRYEFSFVNHLFVTLQSEKSAECVTEESIADCAITKLTSTLFFKPNVTTNLQFERFKTLSFMSRLPVGEYLKEASLRRTHAQAGAGWPWSWDLVYNPVGKTLLAIPGLRYDEYAGHIRNLDGFLRLVSLQIEIKKAAIRDADIPKFLGRVRPELHNPYTGEPMQWDNQNRTLYFNGMNEKTDEELLGKRIELRL